MGGKGRLGVWRALIDGEWVVTRIFERNGRRFMVAHRSSTGAPRTPLLTGHEEQALALRAGAHGIKQIAHALAVSQATVSRRLWSGMRKLGLSAAPELTRFDTR